MIIAMSDAPSWHHRLLTRINYSCATGNMGNKIDRLHG
jgi:hypothetical protein